MTNIAIDPIEMMGMGPSDTVGCWFLGGRKVLFSVATSTFVLNLRGAKRA